jgi:hypothetical protein
MKKVLIVLSIVLFASCAEEQDPFEWNKDRIGHLTKDTMVSELDSIYATDSIVNASGNEEYRNGPAPIEIYEKGGKHLLTLTAYDTDSTATIENVRVRDARFTTEKGINIDSNFKEISEAYKVSSIDNLVNSAVVWIDDQNFYFTIDKEKLPTEVKFDITTPIEKTMIPDSAVPEYVFISW